MLRIHFKAFLFSFLLLNGLIGQQALAQSETGYLIQSGIDNTNKLLKAYAAPLTRSFSTGLNAGWLMSGETFKPGHFEILISGSAVLIPQKDQTFDVSQIGLNSNIRPANPGNTMAPTFFGDSGEGLALDVYTTRPDNGEEVKVATINSPPGVQSRALPVPMAQLNIGVLKGTELMVRFTPEITFSDNVVKLWGIGLKQQINQWIPGLNQSAFRLTASLAYTSLRTTDGLKVRPEEGVSNPNPGDYSSQHILYHTKAYHAGLILSKPLTKALSTHAGLVYSKGQTETGLLGTYPITVIREQPPYNEEITNLTDPVKLRFEQGQPGLTAGLRLRFGIFSLNVAGILAQYSSVSAGIGLGWQ